MADYRLHARIISRADGRSSTAAAAYRSGARIHDARTGEAHDYSRKGGVVHAEILAPDIAPKWVHDRSALWNAVELAEDKSPKRATAQVAREVQLSLPHELTDAQRVELVRSFVREQFVARGMIADVAIHQPSQHGDERNHHAHVMLTTRRIEGDSFAAKKSRDWNDNALLDVWREQWAHHQNRMLERHGHAARVDHRSFEAQGIDREPSQHLGPTAHKMEQAGKRSRIGDENRAAQERNADRAENHRSAVVVSLEIERQKRSFEKWAERKTALLAREHGDRDNALRQAFARQGQALRRHHAATFGTARATIARELQTVEARLAKRGFRQLLRRVTGAHRRDKITAEQLRSATREIDNRIEREQRRLHEHQAEARSRDQVRRKQEAAELARRIREAEERKRQLGWRQDHERAEREAFERLRREQITRHQNQPTKPPTLSREDIARDQQQRRRVEQLDPDQAKRIQARMTRDEPSQQTTPAPAREQPAQTHEQIERAVWEGNSQSAHYDATPKAEKPSASRPWERSASNDRRPWESDLGRDRSPERTRERKPRDPS